MLLPNVQIKSRINQSFVYLGIDSPDFAFLGPGRQKDKNWFSDYPYPIDYVFNSRGFRDQEWPDSAVDLKNSIWCIGDSFTVGVGSPYQHTWPSRLSHATGLRCINISLDGASNSWMTRKILNILEEVQPRHVVVMWSFLQRREKDDHTLDDELRRIPYLLTSDEEDMQNFENCVTAVNQAHPNIVHLTIPHAHNCFELDIKWNDIKGPTWPKICPRTIAEFYNLQQEILWEIEHQFDLLDKFLTLISRQEKFNKFVHAADIWEVPQVDYARDGLHFDILTSDQIVQHILTHNAHFNH